MKTYETTLPDGNLLRTRAVSKRAARRNLAHRLAYSHGHRNAYRLLGTIRLATPQPQHTGPRIRYPRPATSLSQPQRAQTFLEL